MLACCCIWICVGGVQAQLSDMSAAHTSALNALTERLDGALKSIACLEQQLKSGQGELAEMEARVRSLHHELQVWCKLQLSMFARDTLVACCCCLAHDVSTPHVEVSDTTPGSSQS